MALDSCFLTCSLWSQLLTNLWILIAALIFSWKKRINSCDRGITLNRKNVYSVLRTDDLQKNKFDDENIVKTKLIIFQQVMYKKSLVPWFSPCFCGGCVCAMLAVWFVRLESPVGYWGGEHTDSWCRSEPPSRQGLCYTCQPRGSSGAHHQVLSTAIKVWESNVWF